MKILATAATAGLLLSCSPAPTPKTAAPSRPNYFAVDKATAATLTGRIEFSGKRPAATPIQMDQDQDCARMNAAHPKTNEVIAVDKKGGLSNTFVYLKTGLEGKIFAPPATPAVMDQKGCWFGPRVLGIQAKQPLRITNSDPVTHNIHPMAQVNREWNQSQGPGDEPIVRRFARQEVVIPVKCNIHKWMHASIAVVDHPYFAISSSDGNFEILNVPPGEYTVAAWHEKLGWQEQKVTVAPSVKMSVNFKFKGE
ncbi:carboxypeptidase regulatory-like domain-containing protein [Bryobacter aggregatus]|uniref:carboxypeptidase regulatory-like domain-containing protein n=1 Tax=Bryobacter aggregatus TaxID=360054 RepID=UPI000690C5BA|nr:carboxypeptidase regulatory-like domain-containing protein [Bryobacter aggregatus]